MKTVVYGLLGLLCVLHTDVWYWDDPRMVLGAPIGFTYHVLWTLVVTGTFWLAVRYAWPAELEAAAHDAAGAPAAREDGSPGSPASQESP